MLAGTRRAFSRRSPTRVRPACPRESGTRTEGDRRAAEFPTGCRDKSEGAHALPTNSDDAGSPGVELWWLRAAPLLKQLRELREASDLSARHGDRRWETGFILSPDGTHAGLDRPGDVIDHPISDHHALVRCHIQSTRYFGKHGPMRLRVGKIGRVDDRVEQRGEAVGRQVGVVPIRRPPRIREEPQAIAPLAQGLEDTRGLWVDG